MTELTRARLNEWSKFAILIFCLGGAWSDIKSTLKDIAKTAIEANNRSTRIEMYLESKDPRYWETLKNQGQSELHDDR